MSIIRQECVIHRYDNISDIDDALIRQLCHRAKHATSHAYAPYSKYPVGAAVLLEDHHIIIGANQENAVYPLGLCAERVALYSAHGSFPNQHILALAVATQKHLTEGELPPFPCGSCRQTLYESQSRQTSPIAIYIVGADDSVCTVENSIALLPFAFGADSL